MMKNQKQRERERERERILVFVCTVFAKREECFVHVMFFSRFVHF